MGYSIEIDEAAQATIAVLPRAVVLSLAEAFTVLELEPWSGLSVNPQLNPDGGGAASTGSDGLGKRGVSFLVGSSTPGRCRAGSGCSSADA